MKVRSADRGRRSAAPVRTPMMAVLALAAVACESGEPPNAARSGAGEAAAAGTTAAESSAGPEAREPSAGTAGDAASAPTRRVLVVGIDGVRPDVLAEVPTPAIDALIAEGTYSDRARTTYPSVSGPGWSSFLLGVWPEKHGVTDNEFGGKRYDRYPDFLTRIERERPELSTFAVADWLPLVTGDRNGPVISDAVDVKHALDGYQLGWLQADQRSVEVAVQHLMTADPDALFVYLGNPDETSHRTGSIGAEYREAIAAADAQVGRLVEALRTRATYEDENWLVIVGTDHGRRADGGHGGDTVEERTIFFLVSGPSARLGAPDEPPGIVDVAVTALAHLGLAIDPGWGLDGRAVGLVR